MSNPAARIEVTRVHQSLSPRAAEEHLLLTRMMVVIPTDLSRPLMIAYIVEARKAGAGDAFHAMVGDQEMLLPSHKHHVLVTKVKLCVLQSRKVGNVLNGLKEGLGYLSAFNESSHRWLIL